MRKTSCVLLLSLILCLLCLAPGIAEGFPPAENLTGQCQIKVSSNKTYKSRMLKSSIDTSWPCKNGDTIEVILPEGKKARGFAISFLGDAPDLTVSRDGMEIARYTDQYIAGFVPFAEETDAFTIKIEGTEDKYRVNRLSIWSDGVLPREVQQWTRLEEQADLMLIATHPDDELLWFGGLLPTYAGELGKKVIVVNMVGNDTKRRCEYLDGLWTCGVRYYPEIGAFPDRCGRTVESCLSLWGTTEPQLYLARLIRKYKPKVIVTQDIDGEYGHAHHKVTVRAAIDATTELAGDPNWDTATVQQYGTWMPQKLYLHLWKEGMIDFDWSVPLEAFDGDTSLAVARKAFKMHISQQKGKYHVNESGKLDCSLMGLYWSTVGPDKEMKDLFEHIE